MLARTFFRLPTTSSTRLKQQDIQVVTPEDRRFRSGIVTFTLGDAEDNIALTNFLQEHKVLVSVRYTSGVGGVRVSCHLFNNHG